MLRRQLIAYPAAFVVAAVGGTYSYYSARGVAQKVIGAAHGLAVAFGPRQSTQPVPVVVVVRSTGPHAAPGPLAHVAPRPAASGRTRVVVRTRCTSA